MIQIVARHAEPPKPMPESSTHFRIAHAEHGQWYWSIAGMWDTQEHARIFNSYERNAIPLPDPRACWEVVTPPSDLRKPLERSLVAQTITMYLWTQHCREEGLKTVPRLQDVPLKESQPFVKAGEFVTELTLSPDRFETAILAMADVLCCDSSDGSVTIFDASPRTKRHFYQLAISCVNALQANLKELPPDPHYRDQLCRELDAIAPKDGGL